MSNDTSVKARHRKGKGYMLVRCGRMGEPGFFEHELTSIPPMHKKVIVKTSRGLELGSLSAVTGMAGVGRYKVSEAEIREYFRNSGIEVGNRKTGKFIRFATSEDISEQCHLERLSSEEMLTCRRFVQELGLAMKVIDVEHIFGGERVIFYFRADGRVDFRELVKKLAKEYQSRIEMRQIGSRDEAKLFGDVESCGQECCCRRFLGRLRPVNMRMAKMQKATLDPSKISGYCGRLKCCLRYEDKAYTELSKNLPKNNSRVKTKEGAGKVIDSKIFAQLVTVRLEDNRTVTVSVDEIEEAAGSDKTKKSGKSGGADNSGRSKKGQ